MCNAIPVYEAKNRLPYFIHLAETEGAVPIMRRNQEVAYIVSKEEYENLKASGKRKKSLAERINESRAEYGLTDDDDFDYTAYFDSLRDRNYFGRPGAEHIFDGV